MESGEKVRTLTPGGRIVAAVTIAILLAGGAISGALQAFGRKAEEASPKPPVPDVEFVMAKRVTVPVTLDSQGVIEAVTETRAASEVAGRVVYVSPKWDDGAAFSANDELLRLDDADYRAAVASAQSAEADAALQLRMEQARAEQALRDWKKLASGNPESDLVTRKPQIDAANARISAAKAAVEKARHDLGRTTLKAPYDGRIRRTLIDLGSYVIPGTPLAEFYASDTWQVRLPLSLDEFTFLDESKPAVITLSATAGSRHLSFPATLLRTGGEIERTSRTIQVIASVKPTGDPLLAPGLFVKAAITGRQLTGVIRLPRQSLLSQQRVALLDHDNRLQFSTVEVVRSSHDEIFVSSGLKDGDRVVATVLALVTAGMQVHPVGEWKAVAAKLPEALSSRAEKLPAR